MNVTSLIWHTLMKNGILEEQIMNKPKIALTIAGTDPSGGAGVMADLKSFHACGVYGMALLQVLWLKILKEFNIFII